MSKLMQELTRSQKIELIKLNDELNRRKAEDPLKYSNCYLPLRHEKQILAHEAMKAIRVLFWGNRVGKTEWGAMEVSKYLLNKHEFRVIGEKIEVWSACPSYDVQEETTQKKLLKYIPESQIEHITYIRGKIIKNITLKNGNRLTFKSYEQGREKFQGAGKRIIWFDEEPSKSIYEECFVRQEAGVQLDIIMTMTPINGMTWVYDDIYMAEDKSDLFISEAGWEDNPYLLKSQIDQMSKGLSDEAIQVRRFGRFISRVGLVCNWWDREKHLKHYDSLPRNWSYGEVIDGGFSDPLAWLLIAVDEFGNVHVVDGFREGQLGTKDIKEKRNDRTKGLLIRNGYIDTDNPRLKVELLPEIVVREVEKMPGENASWDEALAEKLSEYGKLRKDNGEPQLFISDTLMWLVQEIENLKWFEQKKKEGIEIKPKWDDHRRFKHHFDGIRALAYYLIMFRKPEKNDATSIAVARNKRNSRWGIR